MAALLAADPHNRYTMIYARRSQREVPAPLASNARLLELPLGPRWLARWQRWRLPLPLRALVGPWDLFHSPDFVLPRLGRGRTLVTVHDLSFLQTPQFAEPRLRAYLAKAVPAAVQQADLVLADSAQTKADLEALLGVPPAKVRVLHAACPSGLARVTDPKTLSEARQRLGLPPAYILSLGTLEPRKNFEGLIHAYAELLRAEPARPQHLVLVGRPGWLYQGIFRAVEETGLPDRVHILSDVTDADLPAVYSLADLFAFPSWYEGFGLPPLEAMACGVPVVASNRGSLGEVLGGGAEVVTPEDPAGIAESMARLLDDPARRAALVEAGLQQAAQFSWERSAGELLKLYRGLCDGRLGDA
ncbi:MAG: glycosyltransferase family 4 protein [Chloroflexi bacterium]|nr:glycosyltransferase family 4 protein [Chloroflexota bacterium]